MLDGALAQVLATALMLAAMGERSFVVTIAYIKTEPVQVALFGLVFLGDRVSLPIAIAILIATAGVLVMSLRPGSAGSMRATLLGLGGGGMFALSAIGYRGAILSLEHPNFVVAATFTLAVGLLLQAAVLTLYLAWRDRAVLAGHRARVAAVAAGGLHGGDRIPILVPCLRAGERCQRAHPGAGRSAVRAGDFGLRVRAAHDAAGAARDRADHRRRCVAAVGALTGAVFR